MSNLVLLGTKKTLCTGFFGYSLFNNLKNKLMSKIIVVLVLILTIILAMKN